MTRRLVFIALVAFCGTALAQGPDFTGRVVGVADGDTLTLLDSDNRQHVVRLAEVDAPEKAQAFGNRSKQHLSALCFGKSAVVSPRTTDRYRRTVARVACEGTDASAEQLHAGMAWVFDRYVTDRALYAVQHEARASGRGLWADQQPMAPWEWRADKKRARAAQTSRHKSSALSYEAPQASRFRVAVGEDRGTTGRAANREQ